MKKKFLALVMTLSMVLSLVPMTALAAEDGEPTGQSTMTAENQAASADANEGKQESGSNTGANNASGGDSTGTSDTNTNNGSNENAGGTESGDSSTSGTGSTEGGDTGTGGGTESGGTTTPPESSNKVAKIGNNKYETLDEAIEAAKENDVIELLKDCELTVGTINKTITINGNGKKLTVPKQKKIESGALAINAHATFNNTQLSFANESDWSVTMSGDGVFTLDQHSICTFETHGLYADNNATINVTGGSELKLQDTTYTAMMADKGYAYLNITQGSSILVDHAYVGDEKPNGINNFKIKVENSNITVTNCENQGLVRCQLTLDNSKAKISGNDTGITGYNGTDVLTMKNSSTLTMENNKNAGIFIWGGNVDIQDGNTLTITGTGKELTEATDSRYNGAFVVYYFKDTYKADVKFADGAEVNLMDNATSAINNDGEIYIGKDTTIMNNGSKALYGGGIQNRGQITVADGAKLYNNHAEIAGDDIYNTGTITFGDVGEGWVLDDCNHAITGWYDDGENARWCADTLPRHLKEYAPESGETHQLALKAAHGVDPVPLPEPKLETPEIDKTATPLNQDKSTVTLTVGGSEEKANIAVMFLLDKSTSQTQARQNAAEMLWNLKEKTNTNIIYDVVIFSGTATSTGWRNIADDGTVHDSIANFANGGTTSGTNMTAGIDQAKKDMKTLSERYPEYKDSTFLVTISDGVSYYWDENGVTKCVPIAAWNGNETVFETTPRSDVSTWEMMYSAKMYMGVFLSSLQ